MTVLIAAADIPAPTAPLPACFLIPSQVPGVRHPASTEKKKIPSPSLILHDTESAAGDEVVYHPGGLSAGSRASSPASASSASKKNFKKRRPLPRTGNLPDVHW